MVRVSERVNKRASERLTYYHMLRFGVSVDFMAPLFYGTPSAKNRVSCGNKVYGTSMAPCVIDLGSKAYGTPMAPRYIFKQMWK